MFGLVYSEDIMNAGAGIKQVALWLVVIAIAIVVYNVFNESALPDTEIPFSDFLDRVEARSGIDRRGVRTVRPAGRGARAKRHDGYSTDSAGYGFRSEDCRLA